MEASQGEPLRHRRLIPDSEHTPEMAGVVDRNIVAILARRRADEQRKSTQDRIADRVTRFTGSMLFVYIHLAIFGAWIVINAGWTPLPRWDPSFVVLAMIASVEAIFLSTFVLISQNRMQAMADKRADLDLQVSLLAEHEITQLIALVTEIARKMEVEAARDPELRELAQDVAPEKVLDHMEAHERRMAR
ncbi:MAG: Predicted membrane protein [uncultured Gemmatimonadetes bacterium]|uniref:Predicted membrane protein n=1 Tax=uncultured Gemmatimonadota bacterium TaxID=203437 RepID=A0A6J4MU28_9BACT|nr:MAG: Predicted membrane protein [uncultured Gemmatimonadota bacterium]